MKDLLRRIGPHPFFALAVLGVVLGLFDWFSAGSATAQRRLVSDHPPVYGRFEPSFSAWGVLALALVAVGAFGAIALAKKERLRPMLFLALTVGFLLSFAASIAMINGDPEQFVEPLVRHGDYMDDVHFVHELGVRGFIEEHPDLVPKFRASHSKTHPPGPVVFLWTLKGIFPGHVVPRALVIAALSSLVLIPTWFIARKVANERTAMYAVMLLAVAPAPGIFTFLSMDAFYATMIGTVAALLLWSLGKDAALRPAVIAGVAAGLASFMTYAVGFALIGIGLYALFTRPLRETLRWVVAVALGAVGSLIVLRLALGFDLLASYRAGTRLLQSWQDIAAMKRTPTRSYEYWIFGNVGAWLTFAGLPIAALGLREMFFKRPAYLLSFFAPLALVTFHRFFSAEAERIGQFSIPFMAVGAAAAFERWERDSGRPRRGVFAALIVLAGLQTVLLEALFHVFW